MTRRSNLRKLIFFPWALSVAILCIGSLINFHQYKIWHKPLMQELVATKRENEKNLNTVDFTSFSAKVIPFTYGADAIFYETDQLSLIEGYYLVAGVASTCTIHSFPIGPNGLRAPPLT